MEVDIKVKMGANTCGECIARAPLWCNVYKTPLQYKPGPHKMDTLRCPECLSKYGTGDKPCCFHGGEGSDGKRCPTCREINAKAKPDLRGEYEAILAQQKENSIWPKKPAPRDSLEEAVRKFNSAYRDFLVAIEEE